ncbi:uncharacterized protein EHS24_000911 [Apiotrichum porosum]|uniref:WW domain-containing protein n=1 Tax=Apiotrichum porosum TaxID=105984 RepID=A0A427YB51_9TREE|nr:uncharacterized protein EHS24_000911 [Apiotrichum porosum]RSH88371.1 hypothetical protein EHS24_000911 [Apiotrichum porosum]
MAPKRKTRKSAASAAEEEAAAAAPPLPDEAAPSPSSLDERPPLPDADVPEAAPADQPPLPAENPPLPDEQPPLPTEQPPLPDEPLPVEKDDQEEDDDDDDDEGEGEDGETKDKGKGKSDADAGTWQAVWAPESNAYYFWNTESGEVTWTNPLAPDAENASAAATAPPLPAEPAPPLPSASASTSARPPSAAANGLPEIDPGLAFLMAPEQRGSDPAAVAMAARRGQYAADTGYSFHHLEEYNRAKRFGEHYFDVEGYEKQRAAEALKRKADEEAGVGTSRKVTKKDMERFRAKKAEYKHRRNAWLYD